MSTHTIHPIITPGAEPRVVQMFRESIESHSKAVKLAEALQEKLDETEDHGLSWPECELVMTALSMLIDDREESIEVLQASVKELEEAIASATSL